MSISTALISIRLRFEIKNELECRTHYFCSHRQVEWLDQAYSFHCCKPFDHAEDYGETPFGHNVSDDVDVLADVACFGDIQGVMELH